MREKGFRTVVYVNLLVSERIKLNGRFNAQRRCNRDRGITDMKKEELPSFDDRLHFRISFSSPKIEYAQAIRKAFLSSRSGLLNDCAPEEITNPPKANQMPKVTSLLGDCG